MANKTLPERCIGRTGCDLFSSRKDLTIIMIPFERFSSFAKAVDDLYKSIDVPFNLIVVEGNAPESVRRSLEQRQRKHRNITILYSDHHLSTGGAINLAVPHLNTQYAFLMDDDVRLHKNVMSNLLKCAKEKKYGIVWPHHEISRNRMKIQWQDAQAGKTAIQELGIRTCFLITQEALKKLGKFDETMTPWTIAIDIQMAAEELGIPIYSEPSTSIEDDREDLIWPMDAELHSFQWDQERAYESCQKLESKWGISLRKQDYSRWLEIKKRHLRDSKSPLFLLAWAQSKIESLSQEKRVLNFTQHLLPKPASLSTTKEVA